MPITQVWPSTRALVTTTERAPRAWMWSGAGFGPGHPVGSEGDVGQEASLGVVGEGEVGDSHHLAHKLHLSVGDAVIEAAAVAHDGVDEYFGALLVLPGAVVGHDACLFFTEHQSGAYRIEAEAQPLPDRERAAHVVGGLHDVEVAVVEGVGDECCGEVIDGMALVGEDGQHGYHAYIAVAYDVVDKEDLFQLVIGDW